MNVFVCISNNKLHCRTITSRKGVDQPFYQCYFDNLDYNLRSRGQTIVMMIIIVIIMRKDYCNDDNSYNSNNNKNNKLSKIKSIL